MSHASRHHVSLLCILGVGCVVLASCWDGGLAPGTNAPCATCHGSGGDAAPPADVSGNTATTFTGVGAHRQHTDASTWRAAIACDECHVVPAETDAAGHIDAALPADLTWGPVSTVDGAAPAWNGTTCSGVYCHGGTLEGGTTTSPVWTTVDGTQSTCGSCHGLPPGPPHVASTNCEGCHGAVVDGTPAIKPTGAHLHINGVVDVAATACNSCHGDATGSAPPFDTLGNTATTDRGVGAHQAHVAPALSSPVACDECHVVPTDLADAGHTDTSLPAEVAFGGTLSTADGATPSWTAGTEMCAGSYCHGGTLDGGTATAPVWTTVDGSQKTCGSCHGIPPGPPHVASANCEGCHGAVADNTPAIKPSGVALHINGVVDVAGMACNSCHGDATSSAPPVDTAGNSATTDRGVGAHRAHVSATLSSPVACDECHVVPADYADAGHVDSALPAEIVFGGSLSTADGATPSWTAGTETCAGSYCHGGTLDGGTATAPVWTTVDGSQKACDSCHGSPPGGTHTFSAQCGECHAAVADNTPAIIPAGVALHVDGTVQYDISSAACNACHGGATSDAPPYDTAGNTAPTNRGVGAHQSHVGSSIMTQIDCGNCHTVPGTVLASGHLDGALPADTSFTGIGASTVWNGTTCASTYCHGDTLGIGGGTATTPTWTNVTGAPLACGSCHGDPPEGVHTSSTLCGDCHSPVADNSSVITDASRHIDGSVEYDLTDSPCTAAGCHNHPGPDGWPDSGEHSKHNEVGMWCTDCHYQYAGPGDHYDGTTQGGTGLIDFAPSAAPSGWYNGTSCGSLPGGPCHGSSRTW